MTDRDKLIDLLYDVLDARPDTIADHLLANGVIVPPCKVGDTVYYINTFYQKNPIITKCEVDALHITSGKNQLGHKKPSYALVRNASMKSLSTRIKFEDFGKTVFLIKEEAEAELRKKSDNNA